MLGYKFFNPSEKYTRNINCVKRAFCSILEKEPAEVEQFINENIVDSSKPYNSKINYEHIINLLGGKILDSSLCKTRWHVNKLDKLTSKYQDLKFIVYVWNHVFAIKSNTIFDIIDDRIMNKGILKLYVLDATDEQFEDIKNEFIKGEKDGNC